MNKLMLMVGILGLSISASAGPARDLLECGGLKLQVRENATQFFGVGFPAFSVLDAEGQSHEVDLQLNSDGGEAVVQEFRNGQKLVIAEVGPGTYGAYLGNASPILCKQIKPAAPVASRRVLR